MAGVNPYASQTTPTLTTVDNSSPSYSTERPLHPKSLDSTPLLINPSALIHPHHTVSDKLYSGFVEHLGRGIYGGIVDNPKAPSPKELLVKQDGEGILEGRLGWRKDVMDVIGKKGELEMPMLRWPGGNFVSNYHWQDGIGPISERPVRTELAWLSTESNKFGTDEFIDYARALGVEPYLCLNMGTGTYEEALSWLEYCNGTGDTYWANLRRKNTGRDEPHNVKLWGLGNEMHGEWQVGRLSATDYTKQAARWAHGLKLVDPSIQLVSCGNQGNSDWDREVLAGLVGLVDYHSIHFYTMLGSERFSDIKGFPYEKNVFGPSAAERGIEICKSLIDLAKIETKSHSRDVTICYDEWNVWDDIKAPGNFGLEQAYDFTDALGVAGWLNVLVRQSKSVGIACIAQSVNVISPVMTSPTGLLFQATYWPLKMFSKYMKNGQLLNLSFSSPIYTGPNYPSWAQNLLEPAYIDTVGVIVRSKDSKKASIRLSLINRHPDADFECPLQFAGFTVESVKTTELYHDDLDAKNTFEAPDNVVPTEKEHKSLDKLTIRKHSWAFLIIEGTVA